MLGLGNKTPTASPDHYQAMLITEAAIFNAKLTKWDEHFDGLPPFHVARQLQYYLEFRALAPGSTDRLVFDIGDALEKKIAAIACYESQFGKSPETLERFRIFAQQQGLAAGFSAGEVLGSPTALGTRDLMGFSVSVAFWSAAIHRRFLPRPPTKDRPVPAFSVTRRVGRKSGEKAAMNRRTPKTAGETP